MLVACVSRVDLPMPGSPPTNSTEPRTKPPPVTRSSSVKPEGRRGASLLLPVRVSSANSRPLRLERIETGIVVAPVKSSSASVFHSPQDSHLPCQRLYAAPQFWQTKEREFLAMKGCRLGIVPSLFYSSFQTGSRQKTRSAKLASLLVRSHAYK